MRKWPVTQPKLADRLAEKAQQGTLRGIRDRKRLDAKLLLSLQRGEIGAFLSDVRVHQIADTLSECVLEVGDEVQVGGQGVRASAELGDRGVDLGDRGVDQ